MSVLLFRPNPITCEPIPYLMLEFDYGDRYGKQYTGRWYNKY